MSRPEAIVEFVDDDEVAPAYGSDSKDPGKTPQVIEENWGDQISQTMLEELAPNGEGEYFLDIINNMTEEQAFAIVDESVKFHADDWNFVSDSS